MVHLVLENVLRFQMNGCYDLIITNKMRGEGIRLGGNIKEIWKWTETVRIKD